MPNGLTCWLATKDLTKSALVASGWTSVSRGCSARNVSHSEKVECMVKSALWTALSGPRQRPSASLDTDGARSEEHTSELQSLMRISYAVFCLKKKNTQ